MRIIIILFICVLFSNCNGKSDKLSTFNNLKNTVWIDSLCNEFHFKDSTFIKKRLFEKESNLDEVGKLKLHDDIELLFIDDFDKIKKYYLKSELKEKLEFIPLDKYLNNITLFKKDSIKKSGLEILELKLKIRPFFLSSSGLRDLTITQDKKIEYRRAENKYELKTVTFSDSTFNQLEKYLEILQLDKYEDKYEFASFDGAKYELNIKTNLYTKTIECTQLPTEGLWNLISFIDYKLQTE
ncbi:hypothetical protein [uncultured Dokdonia sp.]|uniref:hypothetical protein n=1 Tax=Dokdonia sp. R78006 TaxID=3093866 RepID=UPI002619091C|nr:hypothetical protein [uncultured Dokdonia sp.]